MKPYQLALAEVDYIVHKLGLTGIVGTGQATILSIVGAVERKIFTLACLRRAEPIEVVIRSETNDDIDDAMIGICEESPLSQDAYQAAREKHGVQDGPEVHRQLLDRAERRAKTPICPWCHLPLTARNGPFGPLWGCPAYPKCKTIVAMARGEAEKS